MSEAVECCHQLLRGRIAQWERARGRADSAAFFADGSLSQWHQALDEWTAGWILWTQYSPRYALLRAPLPRSAVRIDQVRP
ncbi:hypothetical protein [Streptomyces enissocaesilis]|uniref:Uncharacterized protein n=1 Tax=Streptomyces enissocaesilis TaxID=332589 RepID=A0ABN3XNX1_9ACTN